MEESDPNNAVSYANAASLYSAGSEEWFNNELFKDIKPCLLNDGQIMCFLDPNNYS